MEPAPKEVRTISGNFTCDLQLSQTRRITVNGYLYSDDSAADVNKRLDAAQDAIDRQFIRADIINKEAQIANQEEGIKQFRDQLLELTARQQGRVAVGASATKGGTKPQRLSSQELNALQNGEATIKKAQANIDSLRAAIAEGKKKLAEVPA